MVSKRTITMLALALGSALVLGACGNHGQTSGQPTSAVPAPGATAAVAKTAASGHAKETHHTKTRHEHAATSAAAPSVAVASIDLGSAVGADGRVFASTTGFSPSNTIYASVVTSGKGHASLQAKWKFQNGQTLKEETKSISPSGPAVATFAFSNSGGLPVGRYTVEISVDGVSATRKGFSVQ